MKKISILLFSALMLIYSQGRACSMYKITKGGKTIVGNNEDWLSPNSQFWYEQASDDKFGVMYMGLLDNFAQGAINDKGLMFDGFANPYLAVENSAGKKEMNIGDAIRHTMQTMATVGEVKAYFATIDLSGLTSSMIVFVDANGDYLIVEGDELILGKEAEQCFSNFYYSQVPNLEDVELLNVKNGVAYMESSDAEASFDYTGNMMDHLQSVQNMTQYTTIYDLQKLEVRVYLYHDFEDYVTIDLAEKLAKPNHREMIPELFSKKSEGYRNYTLYNDAKHPSNYLKAMVGDQQISEAELAEMGMDDVINMFGYEWLLDKKNPEAAIDVFEYGVELMPNDANLWDSLGEAHMRNNNWEQSIKMYNKSLELDPENENAVKKLEEIKMRSE